MATAGCRGFLLYGATVNCNCLYDVTGHNYAQAHTSKNPTKHQIEGTDEEEMLGLLRSYLAIERSTLHQVQVMLEHEHISYQEKSLSNQSFPPLNNTHKISFSLLGPILWNNNFPSGSKFDITILFSDAAMPIIHVNLMDLHL